MALRIALVDDEKPARDELRCLLGELPDIEVVGEAATGREALALVERLRPEVLLLDVRMPGMGGLEVAAALAARSDPPLVIFVTAFDEHALAAFDRAALDYVLKPPHPERLRRAVERARARVHDARAATAAATASAAAGEGGDGGKSEPPVPAARLLLRRTDTKAQLLLAPAEIDYFTARGDECFAVRAGEVFTVRSTLAALEAELAAAGFFRVHRAYLVNLERVAEVEPLWSGTWRLTLKGKAGEKLPVSRTAMREWRRRRGGGPR